MKPLPILSVALLAGLGAGALVLNSCGDDDGSTAVVTDAMPNAVIDAGDVPVIDAAVAAFCTPTNGTNLALQEIVSGLTEPIFVGAPKGDERLFVVEQAGRILLIKDGTLQSTAFLDIDNIVINTGNERGLLGLAFHPDFAANGRFFVNYSDLSGDTVVAEYTATGGADVANATGKILLTIGQPESNHNGGMLAFGADGYLYIGSGDGGGGGDQHGTIGNGQDLTTNLGKLLRIDIDSGDPYAIPSDNPYASGGGNAEIWAYGLRNPWRFSFDSMTGELYIGDVGQGGGGSPIGQEEINVQPGTTANVNYGWRVVEGTQCYLPTSGCDTSGKVAPVHTYSHGASGRCITGGYVYRGSCLPDIQGWYFFGDYVGDKTYSFEHSGGAITNLQDQTASLGGDINGISSFGEDGFGELYVTSRDNGKVFRLIAAP
jgi:glucose/arabinose dehydrogenase